MKCIGIIGYGDFGRFLIDIIPTNIKLTIVSRSRLDKKTLPSHVQQGDISEVAKCDVVFLCIPLEAHEEMLKELSKHLSVNTLVVDVCSVKERTEELFDKYIPQHPHQLCTHPLFGPQSAAVSTAGLTLVITRSRGHKANTLVEFSQHVLRLKIHYMTATEHDKQMALVHALTFFNARGLLNMDVHKVDLMTPSFQKILDLSDLEAHHSEELFMTIQRGNRYAQKMRAEFIQTLRDLDEGISQKGLY